MKVQVFTGKDYDDKGRFELVVNDKSRFYIGCLSEYPEDASLERDLKFVYDIVPLMRDAYEAGKNGEPFELTDTKMENED